MSKTEQCLEALSQAKDIMDSQAEEIKNLETEVSKLKVYKEKHAAVLEVVQKQNELLESLNNSSLGYGTVISMDKRSVLAIEAMKGAGLAEMENSIANTGEPVNTCRVIFNGSFSEVVVPSRIEVKPGDAVKIISTDVGINIVEKADHVKFGPSAIVKQILDEERAMVTLNGSDKIILSVGNKLEVDDKVLLDDHAIIVLGVEKKEKRFLHTENTGVSWDDIGGQKKAKEDIIEAIEGPIRNAEMYKAYGMKPPKGLLLYGPPGNGKTMFGKAISTSVKTLYGSDADGFIYVKGPEILNMYVGNSEAAIRSLFEMARAFKEKHNAPAVLFIDEAEAILSKRGSGRSSDVDKTIVPQFLSEMDGLSDSAAIVVLTTNRPDMLDSAVIREGRIDKKIKIGKPDIEAVQSIFNLNLKKVPVDGECKTIVDYAASRVFDSGLVLYELELESGTTRQFTYSDIINGAMITAIVTDAVGMAIKRDMAENTGKSGKSVKGVSKDLLDKAIINSFEQNARMNHELHLEDLQYELAQVSDKIKHIRPVKANTNVREEESIA